MTLGKIEGKRRRVGKRMRWLDSITDSDINLSKFREMKDRGAWNAAVMGPHKVRDDVVTEY